MAKRSIYKYMCQRPERAFFISTRYCDVIRLLVQKCVNALNGLFSFLQSKIDIINYGPLHMCQRPERAFFISTFLRI